MAASARPVGVGGERATSFAMACSLLSRYVRQNGAAAAELGLGIRGEEEKEKKKKNSSLFLWVCFGLVGSSSSASVSC